MATYATLRFKMCNIYLSLCHFIVGDAGSSICISLFSTLVAVRDLLLLIF